MPRNNFRRRTCAKIEIQYVKKSNKQLCPNGTNKAQQPTARSDVKARSDVNVTILNRLCPNFLFERASLPKLNIRNWAFF